MITRELLITTVKDAAGNTKEIVGRYDAVFLAHRGYKIIGSEFRKYRCTEEDFIATSQCIGKREVE